MPRRLLWLVFVSFALPAVASDGVVEINQATVLARGGFPYVIGNPGSYLLTSDLLLPDLQTTGVLIRADGVSLDLNGFSIRGPDPNSCGSGGCSTGDGVGIASSSGGGSATTVRNGSVIGVGGDCVALAARVHIEGMLVQACGGRGISLGDHAAVLANRVVGTGDSGLSMGQDSIFADNVVAMTSQLVASAPAIDGGSASGGNVCDDDSCSRRGARRYYLTAGQVSGAGALAACAAGYHMASVFEIREPTSLEYDTRLGMGRTDSGSGPPVDLGGWVRTGDDDVGLSVTRQANCQSWTAGVGSINSGSLLRLLPSWPEAGTTGLLWGSPWAVESINCAGPAPVWCVED